MRTLLLGATDGFRRKHQRRQCRLVRLVYVLWKQSTRCAAAACVLRRCTHLHTYTLVLLASLACLLGCFQRDILACQQEQALQEHVCCARTTSAHARTTCVSVQVSPRSRRVGWTTRAVYNERSPPCKSASTSVRMTPERCRRQRRAVHGKQSRLEADDDDGSTGELFLLLLRLLRGDASVDAKATRGEHEAAAAADRSSVMKRNAISSRVRGVSRKSPLCCEHV